MTTPDTKMELQYIKARFLARQYRQCIQQCEEALSAKTYPELAHHVYLNFYAALSQDSLARLMHDFSSAKVTTFTAAESRYLEALDALSKAVEERRRMSNSHLMALTRKHRHSRMSRTIHSAPPLGCESVVEVSESEEGDDDTESHCGFGKRSSSIINPYLPKLSLNSPFSIVSPPIFSTESRLNGNGKDSSESTAHQNSNIFKIAGERLLEAPSRPLLRSKSSMHLMEGLKETDANDDPFNDDTTISPKPNSEPKPHLSLTSPIIPGNKTSNTNINSPTPRRAATANPSSSPLPSSPYSSPLTRPTTTNSTFSYVKYTSHLLALQTQLQTHLSDLRHQKTNTLTAQAARSSRRAKITLSSSSPFSQSKIHKSPFTGIMNQQNQPPTPLLPSTKSYWSFKDSASKLAEKKERIENLRARGWRKKKKKESLITDSTTFDNKSGGKSKDEIQNDGRRNDLIVQRFDNKRYIKLATDALGELEDTRRERL